jgi:hypothetical protein
MSDVMHAQIWTTQQARHTAPLLSIANGRDAVLARKDQSIDRPNSRCRFQPFGQCHRFCRKKQCSRITVLGPGHDEFAACPKPLDSFITQCDSPARTHEIRCLGMTGMQRLPVFATAPSDLGLFLGAVIRLDLFLPALRLVSGEQLTSTVLRLAEPA